MEIFYDFDFVDDKLQSVNLKNYIFTQKDIRSVHEAYMDALEYIETSVYSGCFKDVYILITDCPATPIEYVDYEPSTGKLHVHLNILSVIWDYYNDHLYRKLIFKKKWKEIDLYTYAQFFILHEFGHIIHSQLTTPSENQTTTKFESHVLKHKVHHINLDEKYNFHLSQKLSKNQRRDLEKEYRNLPHEKNADNFAKTSLNKINTKISL